MNGSLLLGPLLLLLAPLLPPLQDAADNGVPASATGPAATEAAAGEASAAEAAATAAGATAAAATEPSATAAAPDWEAAVAAYWSGRYDEAARAFAALAETEPDGARAAVLHANAGTAAAHAERLGEAIWQLRRARQLLPRDRVSATNLERVRSLLGVAESETGQFARTLRDLPLALTRAESGTACALAAGLALLLLAAWRAGRAPRAAAVLAGLLLVAAAACWGFSRLAWQHAERQAVVIDAVVTARREPGADAPVQFRLEGGTLVSDEEQRGDWRLVQTDAGARGWVPAAQVRPLR